MKKNQYFVEHFIEELYHNGYTNFISHKEFLFMKGKIRKEEYSLYSLYPDSNYVLLYKKEIPPISLLKIEAPSLRHQDILGALYHLGIKEETFGDIVKYQDAFYLFVISSIKDYLLQFLVEIKNEKVHLEEAPLSLKENFVQKYNVISLFVSSLRLDNVLSSLLHSSRSGILDKFKNKEVVCNYEETIKPTRTLRVGDVFSVRKCGKYKFNGVLKETKKGGFIIEVLEYK